MKEWILIETIGRGEREFQVRTCLDTTQRISRRAIKRIEQAFNQVLVNLTNQCIVRMTITSEDFK